MNAEAPLLSVGAGAIAAAVVTHADPGRVGVRSDAFGAASVRLAVQSYRPKVGDSVLVASAPDGARYVIGVLRALREVGEPLVIDDGSSASAEQDDEGQVLRVRDGAGRLVFEHRPGKSVVHAPEGDLELSAEGRISLRAKAGVEIDGGERFVARADGPVALRSGTDTRSELALDGARTKLATGALSAKAERAAVELDEASLVVGTLRTVAHRLRERAEVVERTAGRVLEKAREVYREIDELSQTRAGRIRLVAEHALYAIAEQTVLKAREDVKIKGKKIYLA